MDDDDAEDYTFEAGTVVPEVEVDNTSPTFFDFIDHPDLELNIAPVDEILVYIQYYLTSLVTNATKKTLLDNNNKQLFSMLCCFAYDSVSTTKGTTNTQELYLLCVSAFNSTFDNMFMREEYVTIFLSHFPKKTWPPSFVTYLENLRDELPSEKWVKSNAKNYATTSDQMMLKKLLFGFKIMDKAKDAFKEIRLHYNRFYNVCFHVYCLFNFIVYIFRRYGNNVLH